MHVDATLLLLDPEANPAAIPNQRHVKRIMLFRQGELGRIILDALRDAPGELSTAEIVTAIIAAGGPGEEARRMLARACEGTLPTSGDDAWS